MAEESKQSGQGGVHGAPSPQPEKTANWPANPGQTQPKDRGVGVPKIKQSMLEDF